MIGSRTTRKLILLVDPDPHLRASLRGPLENAGFSVGEACSGQEGERTIKRIHVDAVIVDVMPESVIPGGSVAEKLKATGSGIPVYVFAEKSIATREDIDLAAMNIAGVFTKPFDTVAILHALRTRLKVD
ncbi:MAG: response regulator [Ktedonobacterales bacterium]